MLSHGPFLTCGSQYPVCSSNIWNLYNRTLAVEGIHVLAKQVSFILFLWLWKVCWFFFFFHPALLTVCLHFSMLSFSTELLLKHRLCGTGPAPDLSNTSINLGCCSQLMWKCFKSAYIASVPCCTGAMILFGKTAKPKWCLRDLSRCESVLWQTALVAPTFTSLSPEWGTS